MQAMAINTDLLIINAISQVNHTLGFQPCVKPRRGELVGWLVSWLDRQVGSAFNGTCACAEHRSEAACCRVTAGMASTVVGCRTVVLFFVSLFGGQLQHVAMPAGRQVQPGHGA